MQFPYCSLATHCWITGPCSATCLSRCWIIMLAFPQRLRVKSLDVVDNRKQQRRTNHALLFTSNFHRALTTASHASHITWPEQASDICTWKQEIASWCNSNKWHSLRVRTRRTKLHAIIVFTRAFIKSTPVMWWTGWFGLFLPIPNFYFIVENLAGFLWWNLS